MDNRIIPITYDLDLRGWATETGGALRSDLHPQLFLYELPVLNITFKRGQNTFAMPATGVHYLISIDDDYSEATALYMELGSAFVNAALSWRGPDGDFRDPVPTDGEMTIQLTGGQPGFLERLGNAPQNNNTKIEIQIRNDSSNELEAVYVAPLICASLINKGTPPIDPAPDAPQYVTTDMLASILPAVFREDVNYVTSTTVEVQAPTDFLVQQIILTTDAEPTGLEFELGSSLGPGVFVADGTTFDGIATFAVLGIAADGKIYLTITSPSSVPAAGKIIVRGIKL